MKHEQDLNMKSDENIKDCEKEEKIFIDTSDIDEGKKGDQIKYHRGKQIWV